MSLKKLSRCEAIVFDKTGTLTFGTSSNGAWEPRIPNAVEANILYSLEKSSSHPAAKAILESIRGISSEVVAVKNFKTQVGHGVEGWVDGDLYSIQKMGAKNRNIGFFKNNQCILHFDSEFYLRPEVKEEIEKFKQNGVDVYLLTGDKEGRATKVSQDVGILSENTFFEVDPENKSKIVNKLSRQKNIIYVGDGMNDSLAMANGLVGISMQQSVDATFYASDIHILKDGIKGLADLHLQSKKAISTIRTLLVVSAVYNGVFGLFALMGFITPLIASLLMPLSSLSLLGFGVYSSKEKVI